MSKVYSANSVGFMHNQDGAWQENEDSTWSVAIPLPFYGLKKKCHCGKSFWKEKNYRKHYRAIHTDSKHYIRLRNGVMKEPQDD